jgi:hypothetical protein
VGAGDALLEDGLFGGDGGELEGAAISGPGLVGAAEFAPKIRAGGVIEVIAVEFSRHMDSNSIGRTSTTGQPGQVLAACSASSRSATSISR